MPVPRVTDQDSAPIVHLVLIEQVYLGNVYLRGILTEGGMTWWRMYARAITTGICAFW